MNHAEPAASAHDLLALMPAHHLPHPGSSGHLKEESEDLALPWHGWEAASCPMLAKRKQAAILCVSRATSHTAAAPLGPKDRGGTLFLLELAPRVTWPHGITLSEGGCVLPCFLLLSQLLIKQGGWHLLCEGRMVAHPQMFRADLCHPFRLPLLHGGKQG